MNCVRPILFGIAAGVALLGPTPVRAEETPNNAASRWDRETLRLFATLPIQEGGRIKPLDTFAGFQLLKINGRRWCKDIHGNKLTALEWLLDVMFFPERAAQYRVFLIENSDALDAVGLAHEKRRDRYSYEQLTPVLEDLFRLAHQYVHITGKDRDAVQTQLVNLASNLHDFEQLTRFLEFSEETVSVEESKVLTALFPNQAVVGLSELLPKIRALSAELSALRDKPALSKEDYSKELVLASEAIERLASVAHAADVIAMIPPPGIPEESEEWLTPGEVFSLTLQSPAPPLRQLMVLDLLGLAARQKDDPSAFRTVVRQLHTEVVQLAKERGEYNTVNLEVMFYRAKFFYRSLLLYVVSFVSTLLTWAARRNRLRRLTQATLALATGCLVAGIIMRCVIRGRPPVTTLYESILFITAVAVVLAIAMECLSRQQVGLGIAAILGMVGLFLANKYEARERVDTMPSMVAVLDTNFWLSTHVTTITAGYAAGLLAGAVAHIYILGQLFRVRKDDHAFYDSLARMTYGMICFSLLFSVAGTVLGGIWANYSWGRFWGWDPKENGALMIILWQLATLHARLGGYIRDFGTCLAAVFGGMVVAFSWFGVNLLGVGLHAYGFTSGAARSLMVFYIIEGAVLVCGLVWAARKLWSKDPLGTSAVQ